MASGSDQPTLDVQLGESTFVVAQDGDDLRVGTRTGEGVLWQEETVPLSSLPAQARTAFEAGDSQSSALTIALQGIVDAFAQRGG